MPRNRVRRSFTVETKSRGRQAPAFLPVRAPLLESGPERLAPSLFEAVSAPRPERPEPRRILPSLMLPQVSEPEPDRVEPAAEPPLPRVRRVAARRRVAAPERETQPAPIVHPVPELAEIVAAAQQAAPGSSDAAERAPRRTRRAGEDLRLGERWKRRLPRVCW